MNIITMNSQINFLITIYTSPSSLFFSRTSFFVSFVFFVVNILAREERIL